MTELTLFDMQDPDPIKIKIDSEQSFLDANIAFFGDYSWAIHYPYGRISGLHKRKMMPRVNCPIVDTRGADIEFSLPLLQELIKIHGVEELDKLLDKLQKKGIQIKTYQDLLDERKI